MKNILKTSLTLTFPVDVEYETLAEEPQHGLPEQTDLLSVTFVLKGKTGRKRKIDVLQLLDESEVINLEDEINEKGEKNDH
tara:strand:+ start:779 stop:1021 length:243 start_codon:yes stop_codon:yes gene_type:complete